MSDAQPPPSPPALATAAEGYAPCVAVTRGGHIEAIHLGAAAVVTATGDRLLTIGRDDVPVFMRSASKPFQALSVVAAGALERFGISPEELALMCASHSGTEAHVAVAARLLARLGLGAGALQCGSHPPFHRPSADALRARGQAPGPLHHNCSGKHGGMLALARVLAASETEYTQLDHPVQQRNLATISRWSGIDADSIITAVDGCSVPNFALPLAAAARAYARLSAPTSVGTPGDAWHDQPAGARVRAAMASHPQLVGGPERFDTDLMTATGGGIVAKSGAEGYFAASLAPGRMRGQSAAVGLSAKIADGDTRGRAMPAFILAILHRLGALSSAEHSALSHYGPQVPVKNARDQIVGMMTAYIEPAGDTATSPAPPC